MSVSPLIALAFLRGAIGSDCVKVHLFRANKRTRIFGLFFEASRTKVLNMAKMRFFHIVRLLLPLHARAPMG